MEEFVYSTRPGSATLRPALQGPPIRYISVVPSPRRPSMHVQPSRRQALLVRPGARFVCHADGVCCSDVHALGPISETELVPLRLLIADPVVAEPAVKGLAFRTADGGCLFLRPDHLCRVHADLGVAAKPATCRRYPFNLVATPVGLRVVTPHRCPCRTLGPRPLVTAESVAEEIMIPGAPLAPDHHVSGEVRVSRNQRVRFAAWLDIEAQWLGQIAAASDLQAALQSTPWPALRGTTWNDVALRFTNVKGTSSFDLAAAYMGRALTSALTGVEVPCLPRPWARFFEAADRRVRQTPQATHDMFADWLADEVWSLQWTTFGSFARGRGDLATRLAVAQRLAQAFESQGLLPERAVAEALLVVDVITHCELWFDVARAMEEP